jgi:hypothetical protein
MSDPSAPDPAGFVESAWRDQAIWSAAAGQLKSSLSRWRITAALAGALGALLTTAAATLGDGDAEWKAARAGCAGLGTLLLALVPYVLKARVSTEQVRAWTRARAASEALKEAIYRYLLGAQPFSPGAPPAELVRRCQAIKQGLSDLGALAATVAPVAKARPTSLDADGYVAERIDGQVDGYYYKKARANALAARRWRALEFALSLVATALSAIAGLAEPVNVRWLGQLGPWAAVVTTIAGAVAAHIAASRYDHQATIYFSTAERLRGLRDEWLATPGRLQPEAVAALVDNCERAISAENEAWLAEWSSSKTGG